MWLGGGVAVADGADGFGLSAEFEGELIEGAGFS